MPDLETFEATDIDTETDEITPPVAPKRTARLRTNAQAEALTQAHIALMENELLTRSQQPELYRLVNNQYAALQNWHDEHTGWRIRRGPSVMRLVRTPVSLIPGYVFRTLREPRDFACFAWTLWYAESRQMAGRGNDQQFLMSQLAEQLEEQSMTGQMAVHVAPLDFKKQADRYSLSRALKALQELGGLQLEDGNTEEWVTETGKADALWTFTEVTRSLMQALEIPKVQSVVQKLDGDPNSLKPALLPVLPEHDSDPLQRAWRTLLLGPTLLRYDDPAAFAALESHAGGVQHELAETFGWQLDMRQEYAQIIRATGTSSGPIPLLSLQGAADHAALLICDVVRQKVAAHELNAPDLDGCILVAENEIADIFRQVRERYGHRWGSTARKTHFRFLLREVYAKMRLAGLIRGPDRNFNILILPTAARFAVSYGREDIEDEAAPPDATEPEVLAEQTVTPPPEQLSLDIAGQALPELDINEVKITPELANGDGKKEYSTLEVGQIIGRSDQTVVIRIKAGVIKGEKRGKNYVVPAEEVARLRNLHQTLDVDNHSKGE